jgi:sugar/nucleoside kinase (ribokinase family)/energy-coupling factor transporter ATP-binding protein EcfA2
MVKNDHKKNVNFKQIVKPLKTRKKILCIGDLLIDVVFKGEERHELEDLNRMKSPPHIAREYKTILDCNSFNVYPGGAAGLACYLQALGNDVSLISTYGWSDEKDETKYAFTKTLSCSLIGILKKAGINCDSLVFANKRPIPVKIYAYYQINQPPFFEWIPRIDLEGKEARNCINDEITQKLLAKIPKLDQFDAVVLEDNAKGLLSQVSDDLTGSSQFAEAVIKKLEDYTGSVFVDPRSNWDFFRNLRVHSVLPDHFFATRAIGGDPSSLPRGLSERAELMRKLTEYAEEIFDRFDLVDNFVIKCEHHGVLAIFRDKSDRYKASCLSLPAWRVHACSTVGCGDTFDAYYISLVLRNIDPRTAIEWANLAGGLRAEKGMGFFPSASQLEEGMHSLNQHFPKFKKMDFESKVYQILKEFKSEIRLDDCVLVMVEGAKRLIAKNGAMIKIVCDIIEKLQTPKAKVLLYGPSRSGKSTLISIALQAVSHGRPKAYGEMRYLSQNYFETNDVSAFKDVDSISGLLDLGETWTYKNVNGEQIDLSDKIILFDTSLVEEVEMRKTDLIARGISLIRHRSLGEDKDALKDAVFFIGNLLSDEKLNIETRVFAALLEYPYTPGQGWNKLEEMIKAAISKAKQCNRNCVTKDDFPGSISSKDESHIIIRPRRRSADRLIDICREVKGLKN